MMATDNGDNKTTMHQQSMTISVILLMLVVLRLLLLTTCTLITMKIKIDYTVVCIAKYTGSDHSV